ncbi:hypothetical protein KEH51_12430 [[Brevibacterium] frigoritolerans]|uniref:Uncharacterized protein n=1 Tax=Peribacillus frigoritolerans TaxID=450367 RepID=A0A941J7P1_9BACI|nr:hypothetical protein [Peribacillus frigoritolerans]
MSENCLNGPQKLKDQWQTGVEQEVVENYVHREMIPWDEKTFTEMRTRLIHGALISLK